MAMIDSRADAASGGPTPPTPVPTEVSAPHWDGARKHALMVQRCADCDRYVFPPERGCYFCLGDDLRWVRSSGLGTVHTFSVVWRPQQPTFSVPYIAAVVHLDEGWYMWTNLVGVDPEHVSIDMEVQAAFTPVEGGVVLPTFAPRSSPRLASSQ